MKTTMMMCVVVASALAGIHCGGAPTAPAPLLAPTLSPTGSLIVSSCLPAVNGLVNCAAYSGTVTNAGPGCGINVHGVTKSYVAGTLTQIGSSEWTYGNRVKVGEQISYSGTLFVVPAPLQGGWSYVTTVTADPMTCQ